MAAFSIQARVAFECEVRVRAVERKESIAKP